MTQPARVGGNLLTDNPGLYETQFPDTAHVAARFVHDLVTRYGPPSTGPRRLLDLGSGTGRDAGYLARAGYHATGIDSSPRMLDHARRQHPMVRFHDADMREFTLGHRFDVITCMDSALLHCHQTTDLCATLERCRSHLVPGGLLIAEMRNGAFFLGNTATLDTVVPGAVRWRDVTYTSHTRLWIDHAAQLLRRERIWTWPGQPEPLVQASAWRLLFPQELRHLLAAAGFAVLALFDGPGPRTRPRWRGDGAEPSGTLAGNRLHVVARTR